MTEKLLNVPLGEYTGWRTGGPAKVLYKPAGIPGLVSLLKTLPEDEPLLWLGLGSNMLIRDGGFKGSVILTQGCLNALDLQHETQIRVEAGVSCAKMARFCARNNLAGGEFWAGIPGTMGGALRMNAGCFNHETWEFVIEVETITRTGELRRRKASEFSVAYREVSGQGDEGFVSAICTFPKGEKDKSLQQIKDLLAHRAATQPTSEHNCGSVFRNPENNYAARLIESCGLKGKRLGGASVSEKHANFIISDSSEASAQDIENLIRLIQQTVHQQHAIHLVQEVHIYGEDHAETP